jgi:hypothetical protein
MSVRRRCTGREPTFNVSADVAVEDSFIAISSLP